MITQREIQSNIYTSSEITQHNTHNNDILPRNSDNGGHMFVNEATMLMGRQCIRWHRGSDVWKLGGKWVSTLCDAGLERSIIVG